ncbi:MAG TPA: geranylgeranylglyceryl/heptaprenylglyceryl phosphate synthase [Cryomorphaceae bacterium]|nr:geranylgeranylglyceryl/heptaprenylglyceryl phosphate synthase [Owenweeksia sp.]MBF98981.1 geranylgeranylglyceryl/heptaprenylglyceryl phosphate synthase [Owenweeksia sp.]HAD95946.1 geranylgeranylglyceryl/heptaprenylglyceryl phosphate synthase [Cryomorphaceae bacterium]HBF19866.1 geranylgeranylglyceryl/heptaprenylglyceryl phosphate synthase [Cryomorphaceae bacterium]|tara:strand:- start:3411 stop:4154 length:744 start_codon:yes stop_codon:yes gene_type:complete
MDRQVLHIISQARQKNKKLLAVLIDPDTPGDEQLLEIIEHVNMSGADLIFVGGSLLTHDSLDQCLKVIKSNTKAPVILFPGSVMQISPQADAILFLSLISGRNPELLIGNQVIAAPYIRQSGLEVLPTGYMLIDSGRPTTASYMSNSLPIPHHKSEIAACTAMAGEMLGLKLIYMDGGSGADKHVSTDMIEEVRKSVDAPIIIGGGIRNAEAAQDICRAGADVIVVGNATESNPAILKEIAEAIHNL